MKKLFHFLPLIAFLLLPFTANAQYKYESVPNDPLKTRIYTLDNGLKIYLSVNKDKPRIQTFIGVRVGSKNDPAETTGLAHYFEHLMFKGTKNFGTSDYTSEEPLLNNIELLFEEYRRTTDEAKRKAIYADIDSISQVASTIAIPNEYDKLMSTIGSQGTNAFTSYDVTAYIENVPSNEVENWAMIQADRFTNPVIRLFHTELETVYEEYNMNLTRDGRKILEAILSGLFPHHPYGTQTVLGTQEHLKNPSITNIKKYFETYYVPNNMTICMVGDFDPDAVVTTIDKYFGSMQRKELPILNIAPETAITKPIVKEVTGLEAASVAIAYRMPEANSKDAAIAEFVDYLLTNGNAGLIDLNIVQKQKILRGGSSFFSLSDYSLFYLSGMPKEGQSLDDVKDLLISQVELLKKGEFEDWLLKAVINNFKLNQYNQQEDPTNAAQTMLNAFINNIEWKDEVEKIDFQSKLTKKDIVDFCNKYFNNNHITVYKRQGKVDDQKIDKPQITPISTNRDNESKFLSDIKERPVTPIQPVFIDYNRDLSKLPIDNGLEILYKQNTTNPLFSLYYVFEMGNNNDKALGTAFQYLNYLGTSKHSAEEIKRELYEMACSFSVSSTNERVYVSVNGLSDNFDKALALLEERLADAVVDTSAYNNLTGDILKSRSDAKLNQRANFSMLNSYATWGAKSPATNILSKDELTTMDPNDLINRIKNLKNYKHRILYYGPLSKQQITESIKKNHHVAKELKPISEVNLFTEQETKESSVLLANYDSKQVYIGMLSKGGIFDKNIESVRKMYNSYFGGGMNSIVFQEMREARGLAYSANAGYSAPDKPERSYYIRTFIASQNDKMKDALTAFDEILNDMPESEKAFDIAKESVMTSLRTERTLREDVLWNYINAEKFGYKTDVRQELFDKLPSITLNNVVKFQQQYIKSKPFTYCILGDLNDIDIKALEKLGKVRTLTQEELFGY